jgi:hypothetical protein
MTLLPDSAEAAFVCLFICFFVVLGFELRAYTLSHSTSLFCDVCFFFFFFEVGSCELFAQADFTVILLIPAS